MSSKSTRISIFSPAKTARLAYILFSLWEVSEGRKNQNLKKTKPIDHLQPTTLYTMWSSHCWCRKLDQIAEMQRMSPTWQWNFFSIVIGIDHSHDCILCNNVIFRYVSRYRI
jgi:hypothetical protein